MAHAHRLVLPLAGALIALAGCSYSGGQVTYVWGPDSGSGASAPSERTGLEPFSLSNCLHYDAVPQQCERTVLSR